MELEKRGIPTVLIGTDRFTPVFEAMRRIGGIPDISWATVSHPLGSATPEQLSERAASAIEQFERVKGLVGESSRYYREADEAIRSIRQGGSL